jgi:hypothetical protein
MQQGAAIDARRRSGTNASLRGRGMQRSRGRCDGEVERLRRSRRPVVRATTALTSTAKTV